MKLATKDKNLIVFALVVVIVFCSYNYGYKKLKEQKANLEKDITSLEKKIETKREQYAKKDFYEIMTKIYGDKFKEELDKFPEDIQEENQVMFFKEIEQYLKSEKNDYKIPTVSFSEGETFIKFQETEKATGELYEGLSSTVTFPFTLEYAKFKDLLDYLEAYKDRSVISTVSASYNEDLDIVTGSVTFTQYAISEDTRFLLQPEVEDMLLGTDNIFESPDILGDPDDEEKEITVDVLAERIKASFDMFVLLEPATSNFPTTTLGFSNSAALLRENKNEQQLITITVNEIPVPDLTKPIFDEKGVHKMDENGKLLYEDLRKPIIDEKTGLQAKDQKTGELLWENIYEYRATYVIGEGDTAKTIENVLIQPTEYLDLYVYCSDRVFAEETENKVVDNASVKATVINNTTKYDFINIYVVENNYMTDEEKEALAKEEALREEAGKPKREDLTIPRWTIDEEKSTMDKINVVTTTDVEEYLADPANQSSEEAKSSAASSKAPVASEEATEEAVA